MRFPLLIAFRYLISRKSTNVINIITWISVGGVSIGTLALIVILSVFNGLDDLIRSLFNQFDPHFRVESTSAKFFPVDTFRIKRIERVPGVHSVEEIVEENVLLRFGSHDLVARLKGVQTDFPVRRELESHVIAGTPSLQSNGEWQAIPGLGLASRLQIELNSFQPVRIYVPRRNIPFNPNPSNALNSLVVYPSGIFSIQPEIDARYMLVSLDAAKTLLELDKEASALEIILDEDASEKQVRSDINSIMGPGFVLKDRYQQKEFIYKTVSSEKLIGFIILTFILAIASFSLIGSLTMLIIEKRKDMMILRALGCSRRQIRQIFLLEGWLIPMAGIFLGLLLGAGICLGQQEFGWVKLASSGSFVVQSYPVKMEAFDFLLVFFTVSLIGAGATWYPVRLITNRLFLAEREDQVR